jgi:hypothetical protein
LFRVAAHVRKWQHSDRGLAQQPRAVQAAEIRRLLRRLSVGSQHERFYRVSDVLQTKRPKRLEGQIDPTLHVISHCLRDTDRPRRAFGL